MEATGGSETKRMRLHDAQMIPGIDGVRTFGFPNTIITKLRYCERLSLTSSAGAYNIKVFAANGLFDPNISDTGHQPLYYDNYTAIYDQYVVIGSKIKVIFVPRSSTVGMLVGLTGDDDASGSTNPDLLMEQNNSIHAGLGSIGADPKTLTMTFEPEEMFGVDAKSDGSSQTPTTANPTELWNYYAWLVAADGSTTAACDLIVEIDYTVKFSELKTPSLN